MNKTSARRVWGLAAGIGAASLLALEGGARADTVCGSTSAGWNVPGGASVFVSGPGPIYNVITAIGEYRSHSMLSRGPDWWVTHATSVTPPQEGSWPDYCSAPLSQSFLYNAMPGLETVNQGAIYTFLYGGGSSENFIAYQGAGTGAAGSGDATTASTISNLYLGAGMNWSGWYSGSDSSQYVWGSTYNGAQIHYGWFQYMNTQGTPQGVPGVNTGVVCSSSLALWQHDALGDLGTYTGDVVPRTYNNASNNELWNAANALYNSVYNECSNSMGFWTHVGTCLTCADCNLCDEAADQMTNCFAANNCGSSDHGIWTGITGGSGSAVGISPDDISCWNNPANGSGAPCIGSGASVWGWDGNETVQWNSGGSQYSCWD